MSNSTVLGVQPSLFYIPGWGQGGEHPTVDLLGIPSEQITGDLARVIDWADRVVVLDGWAQPSRELVIRARAWRPTDIVYDYSHEAGLGASDMRDYQARVRTWGSARVRWLLNSASYMAVGGLDACCWDYFAVDAVYRLNQGEIAATKETLNLRPSRVNFLAGKLDAKPTRLWALYALWRRGLVYDAELGILATMQQLESHRGLVKDPRFWEWLEPNLGPADSVPIDHANGGQFCRGWARTTDVYRRSMVSYVCETNGADWGGPDEFITEKTYRPIIHRSPFVVQGGTQTLHWLRRQGFNVFDRFVGDPQYGRLESNNWSHIERTADAAAYLLRQCRTNTQEIQTLVDANYHNLIQLARRERARARQFIGLPPT